MIGPGVKGDCPARYADYLCTRDLGHRGEHVSHGVTGIIVAKWAPARKPIIAKGVQCDGVGDCCEPVTYIGGRGWAYCAAHAANRRGYESVRKLTRTEADSLAARKPVSF